jgi:hypothetical protein
MDLGYPIINSPYDPPQRHFEIGPHGPTGVLLPGRRPSESFIPVPPSRKGRRQFVQEAFDFDITGERREANTLVNDVRREVERWVRTFGGTPPRRSKPSSGNTASGTRAPTWTSSRTPTCCARP